MPVKLKKNMNYPKKINIRTESGSYPILIGNNILKNFNKNYLQFCPKSKKILFITNTKIPNKYFYSIKKTIIYYIQFIHLINHIFFFINSIF